MATAYLPTLVTVGTGTGSSANLVASSAGQNIRVWQLIVSGTVADTISIAFTVAGVAVTVQVNIAANDAKVLPMSGVPWAVADVGTAVTFTAAATTKVAAYYTKGA